MLRSDMAIELIEGKTDIANYPARIKKSIVEVDGALSKKINRPEGIYITLETGIVKNGRFDKYESLTKALATALKEVSPKTKSVLMVGLGNPSLTADALGQKVFENLIITRHISSAISSALSFALAAKDFKGSSEKSAKNQNPKAASAAQEKNLISIAAICPNVSGVTGIESFDIIKGVSDRINPGLIIAVDSLASASVGRIASAFQVCSSGITPGSGVGNHRLRLSRETLGVDVVSIGVPLVVYATTIILEAAGHNADLTLSDEISNLIVTPKTIDYLVDECGKIIAAAINKAFQ